MHASLIKLFTLLCLITACGGVTGGQKTTSTASVEHPKMAPPATTQTVSTATAYNTHSSYVVIVIDGKYTNPQIAQLLRKVHDQCRCPDDLTVQHIMPTTVGHGNTFKLSVPPGMGSIIFQVLAEGSDDEIGRSIKAYEGGASSIREIGVWHIGKYNGIPLFKIPADSAVVVMVTE